jgi:UDP-N-acetylmuramoyl-L-alanyl-D-glutamate--2,6-diaminopimelate ligase
MGKAAAAGADIVIVTDDNPRSEDAAAIRREVLAGCPAAKEIGDRAEAIAAGVALLRSGDVLLIAGKGHETGQIIAGVTHYFDDAEEARRAAKGTLQ